jgi:hypothetical protein
VHVTEQLQQQQKQQQQKHQHSSHVQNRDLDRSLNERGNIMVGIPVSNL